MEYKVGIYIRLSKEDINKKELESQSIINQRDLLLSYINNNNLNLVSEYVDDGFSGTTFDRPSFNRLINDINNGKINMVITKDLSRLGRDYIQSGYYLEQYFPMKKVRYVSILDNIDTAQDTSNNDIAPFKALFNDMQSKDTSKKIRSILRNKKCQGLFLGSSASFGYLKDPNDKHKLILDNDTYLIVRRIFDLAISGKSNKEICDILNKDNVITPILYKKRKIQNRCKNPDEWKPITIHNILNNFMYTGSMIQGKQAKLNYKSRLRIILDKDQWIIVENTHEPIISVQEFELANKLNSRIKSNRKREKLLLEGLLYCHECCSILGVRCDKRNKKNIHYVINCNKYLKENICSSHFFRYDILEKNVLDLLKHKINLIDKEKISGLVSNNKNEEYMRKKVKLENKEHELIETVKNIYSDKIKGIVGCELYESMICEIDKSLKRIRQDIDLIDKKINASIKEKAQDELFKIDRELLFTLIDKITISKEKRVRIYYKFSK